ncbi:kinase-like domain-containing protein [Nemania sp. FL0916]|nr:kinase-like domain-containing protein [Nemania sp. FL0916]
MCASTVLKRVNISLVSRSHRIPPTFKATRYHQRAANAMTSFDFQSHLRSIDPASSYHVAKLPGGLVNLTSRASKTTEKNVGTFPEASSLVLKYAPPFVAAIGPAAPFSTKRQEIEASALRLFYDDGPLAGVSERAGIRVPKVLHHAVDSSVLIMEDLGPLVTLWDLLSPHTLVDNTLTEDRITEIGRALGGRVGEFFAALHSADTVKRIKDRAKHSRVVETAVQHLSHSLTRPLIFDAAVAPIRQRLDTEDVEELYARILEDFSRDNFPGEDCFALGDCHPGAVLLPDWDHLAKNGSEEKTTTVAVIDWEFSGLADRGVNGDIAQLLACLHCHLIYLEALLESTTGIISVDGQETSTKASNVRKALAATNAFVRGICTRYAEATKLDDISYSSSASVARLLRSAVILFGRETINQAYEFEWDLEGYLEVSRDELRDKMVAAGAEYVRRAGRDASEALRTWSSGTENRGIISMLFEISR